MSQTPAGLTFGDFGQAAIETHLGTGITAEYLSNYLGDLRTSSFVLEEHYIDRHYLDEYANYYSKSFRPPGHDCQRLHFFQDLTAAALRAAVTSAFGAKPTELRVISDQLSSKYLGFLVVRPLTGARAGRTVLRTYPFENRRHFEVKRDYRVHLAGLRLTVEGLAFQNQDGGAAVCASTALWSALQKVADVAGNRTPTPHAITIAAGSPFPASAGLPPVAVATAIWRLGYLADYFGVGDRALFRALLATCLESGLPVVLALSRPGVGHAVALTGFSQPSKMVGVPIRPNVAPIPMLAGSLDVVYVHDDNLGPHAHYELEDVDDASGQRLVLHSGNRKSPRPARWKVLPWNVTGALVPKPEKLRLAVPKLLDKVQFLRKALEGILGGFLPVDAISYSAHFESGVRVKEQLVGAAFEDTSREAFLLGTSLPRHVGVLVASMDGSPFCHLVVDVSEVDRRLGEPSPLALIAHRASAQNPVGLLLGRFASHLGVPIVFGAASP